MIQKNQWGHLVELRSLHQYSPLSSARSISENTLLVLKEYFAKEMTMGELREFLARKPHLFSRLENMSRAEKNAVIIVVEDYFGESIAKYIQFLHKQNLLRPETNVFKEIVQKDLLTSSKAMNSYREIFTNYFGDHVTMEEILEHLKDGNQFHKIPGQSPLMMNRVLKLCKEYFGLSNQEIRSLRGLHQEYFSTHPALEKENSFLSENDLSSEQRTYQLEKQLKRYPSIGLIKPREEIILKSHLGENFTMEQLANFVLGPYQVKRLFDFKNDVSLRLKNVVKDYAGLTDEQFYHRKNSPYLLDILEDANLASAKLVHTKLLMALVRSFGQRITMDDLAKIIDQGPNAIKNVKGLGIHSLAPLKAIVSEFQEK